MDTLEEIIERRIRRYIPENQEFLKIHSLQAIYFNHEQAIVSISRVIPEGHDDVTLNFRKTFTLKELGGGSYLTKLWNEL